MGYRIETIEIHQGHIDRASADSKRITDDPGWEVMESGLSLWANDSMNRFHRYAIEMLNLGAEAGLDGPADFIRVLVDADGKVISNRMIQNQWGTSWLIGDEGEAKYGRAFVPVGSKSRIQKDLGLREDTMIMAVQEYVQASCSFVGGAMSYRSIPLEQIPGKKGD